MLVKKSHKKILSTFEVRNVFNKLLTVDQLVKVLLNK